MNQRALVSGTLVLVGLIMCAKCESSVNQQCRALLSCAIRQRCIKIEVLMNKFQGAEISSQLYDDLDASIDYGCIFTTGCADECDACPLCKGSRAQLIAILQKETATAGECPVLEKCASTCVDKKDFDVKWVNFCLRKRCAFHCFDGGCPRCKAFTTRIFNQACASGAFRERVRNFNGPCHSMFNAIIDKKFAVDFSKLRNSRRRTLTGRFVGRRGA